MVALEAWSSAAKGSFPDAASLYQGLVVPVKAEYSTAEGSFIDAASL